MAKLHFEHLAIIVHFAWCISPNVMQVSGFGGFTKTSGFFVLTH